jgi:glutamyl-tRNA synthetase
LRAKSDAEIAANIRSQVQETFGFESDNCRLDHVYLDVAVALMKPRVQFEHEIATKGAYLFQSPTQYDQSVIDKRWKDTSAAFFTSLVEAYKNAESFTAETSKAIFEEVAAQQGIKPGEVMQLFRVLVSGEGSGVDMFGMVALLGKVDVCNRIESALTKLGK